jgi:hypothetical protein
LESSSEHGWDDFVGADDILEGDTFIFDYTVDSTLKVPFSDTMDARRFKTTIPRDHPEIIFCPSVQQSMLEL